jgi:hypothetical protein
MRTQQERITTQRTDPPAIVRVGGRAGLIGPALFTVGLLAQIVLRREEFDPISEPMSGLGAGPQGWIQGVNFFVFGILTLLFAAGLHRALAPSRLGWIGPGLLAVTGLGPLWGVVFPLQRDESGVLFDRGMHGVGGTMYFAVGTLAVLAIIPRLRHDPQWRSLVPYTAIVGLLLVLTIPIMTVLTIPAEAPLHNQLGLNQLAIILTLRFPWQMIMASHMIRTTNDPAPNRS